MYARSQIIAQYNTNKRLLQILRMHHDHFRKLKAHLTTHISNISELTLRIAAIVNSVMQENGVPPIKKQRFCT